MPLCLNSIYIYIYLTLPVYFYTCLSYASTVYISLTLPVYIFLYMFVLCLNNIYICVYIYIYDSARIYDSSHWHDFKLHQVIGKTLNCISSRAELKCVQHRRLGMALNSPPRGWVWGLSVSSGTSSTVLNLVAPWEGVKFIPARPPATVGLQPAFGQPALRVANCPLGVPSNKNKKNISSYDSCRFQC